MPTEGLKPGNNGKSVWRRWRPRAFKQNGEKKARGNRSNTKSWLGSGGGGRQENHRGRTEDFKKIGPESSGGNGKEEGTGKGNKGGVGAEKGKIFG